MKKLIVVAMIVIALQVPESLARELTAREKEIVVVAVKDVLTDPDSAKFKWGNISPKFDKKAYADYCVLVNSKNLTGGYAGFKPYVVTLFWSDKEGFNASVALQPHNSKYPDIIYKLCAEDGYNFKLPKQTIDTSAK